MDVRSNINFQGKILDSSNKKLVNKVREHITSIEQNGIRVGNCICKIPQDKVCLTTIDKKYSIGMSSWGNNLIIKQFLNRQKNKIRYFKITPDKNVEYSHSEDLEFCDVKKGSLLAKVINKTLSEILPKFL